MIRIAAALLFAALALPTASQELSREDCVTLGTMAQRASDLRQEGQSLDAATRQMARDYGEDNARFAPAIPFLVDWVYNTLPEAQLGEKVGPAYVTACLGAE